MRREDNHHRARLHSFVEVDDVLVGHADAAGRNRLANVFGLVRSVNTVEGVLITLIKVHCPCAHWVLRPWADIVGHVHALLNVFRRDP